MHHFFFLSSHLVAHGNDQPYKYNKSNQTIVPNIRKGFLMGRKVIFILYISDAKANPVHLGEKIARKLLTDYTARVCFRRRK